MDLLHTTPKTQSDLACPHGVQFYDVAQDAARSNRAAWSYEAPRASMSAIVDTWSKVRRAAHPISPKEERAWISSS
jgi:uncharacterized protein (DUF427 family)